MVSRLIGTIAVGVLIVMGLASQGEAFQELIPTKVGLLKFGGSPASGRLYKLVSKIPPGSSFTLPTSSPAMEGGSVAVIAGSGRLDCTLAPQPFSGSEGWKELGNPSGSKGYKYINKFAPGGVAGPCKVVIMKEKVIKVLAKGTGSLAAPLGSGNPDVETVLTLGLDEYCAKASSPHFKELADRLIKAKNQSPPDECASGGPVEDESAVEPVSEGGTVTTDTEAGGDGATPGDPVETSLTSPNAGTVSILETAPTSGPPVGFDNLVQKVDITAPAASDSDPLVLTFVVDASQIPPGEDENVVHVYRDAVFVPPCSGAPGVAFPDPCVQSRSVVTGGDVEVTVLTSTASEWGLVVVNPGDCCANASTLTFSFGGSGICGKLQNFRCSDDPGAACGDDSDCVSGTCEEVTTAGFPLDLECGSLYSGGGLNSTPLPITIPDMATSITEVTSCNATTGDFDIVATTLGATGSSLSCTSTDCLFGAPMPIPNAITPPTSLCAINRLRQDAAGAANCKGTISLDLPLAMSLHVTGDLLNISSPPNLVGVQPCPLCSSVCVGGSNTGFPCMDDSECDSNNCTDSTQCIAGPNDGLPCTPETSKLDVHSCCSGGPNNTTRCTNDVDCAPLPGPAPRCELSFDPCTDDSDCTVFPGDRCIKCVPGCTSFPTRHDCPPDPTLDITALTGGMPVDLSLTTNTQEMKAVDRASGSRVFCGYCRDLTGVGSLCFEGDTSGGCPAATPAADGNAVSCDSDADCSADADEYESCVQRNPGAFSKAAATRITVTGVPVPPLASSATLVSAFCMPPTFDGTLDNSMDFPGPGVVTLQGEAVLSP